MAIDAFLQFTKAGAAGTIEGETQDKAFSKPKEGPACFEIQNWDFGAQNQATISSATMGAGAGKATFNEFHVVKAIDNATPDLFHTCCVGGHYELLTLWIRKAGGTTNSAGDWYLQWQFAMAFVKEITWSHGDPAPTEDVKFVYGAIQFQYRVQTTKGVAGAAHESVWSQVLNVAEFAVE